MIKAVSRKAYNSNPIPLFCIKRRPVDDRAEHPRAVQASIARTLIVTWTSGVEHTFDLGTSAACSASTTSAVDGYVRLGSNKGRWQPRPRHEAVFAIELQAVSPHGQHRRAYEIHVGSDLFGQLVVTIDFGVIGTRGQRRVHLVADIAEAQAVVRRALRRRLTAPRRIGVPYRVITYHDPGCWLAMMGFQLVDDRLAITVPPLTEPKDHPVWPAQRVR